MKPLARLSVCVSIAASFVTCYLPTPTCREHDRPAMVRGLELHDADKPSDCMPFCVAAFQAPHGLSVADDEIVTAVHSCAFREDFQAWVEARRWTVECEATVATCEQPTIFEEPHQSTSCHADL